MVLPADERYLSLSDRCAAVRGRTERSRTRTVESAAIRVADNASAMLRELCERGDIIKRIHRGLTERGIERGAASFVLGGESLDVLVIGRLVDRGLVLDGRLKPEANARLAAR